MVERAVKMIVTDLDGTLLQPDHSVTARTRAAIRAAQEAGILVLAATGRSVVDIAAVLPPELHGLAVCSNGAVALDVGRSEILLSRPIEPPVIAAFITELASLAPGAALACLVDNGYSFIPGPHYLAFMQPGDHGREKEVLTETDLVSLTQLPAVKVVVRHAELELDDLFARCEQAAHVGVLPTTSGVPFIELSAAGVSKATTCEVLAHQRGITAEQVMVFGDSANDKEMISWAGHGVAMANGRSDVHAVADEIAPPNTADGVAVVIERVLSSGSFH